ncbi:phytanoyl-CoA dioxygenase family protein [Alphaproteobacteria bacterium]|nr:phytanoyl-CoA dioxygenase family protein [Alphaproteobacteria bacterium]
MQSQAKTHRAVQFNDLDRDIFLKEFEKGSWASKVYPCGWTISTFDTASVRLKEALIDMITSSTGISLSDINNAGGLEKLHTVLPKHMQSLDEHELNEVSKSFYDQSNEFLEAYHSLIKLVVETTVGEPCLFQKTPTVRAHFPYQKGFDWLPRYHTDIMLGHPPQEINIWIPLTTVNNSNTMRLVDMDESLKFIQEIEYDLTGFANRVQTDQNLQKRLHKNSRDLKMTYGEFVIFDPRCIHAGQNNKTQQTRISVDARFVPISDYEKFGLRYKGTGRRQVMFERGDYYDERSTDMIQKLP